MINFTDGNYSGSDPLLIQTCISLASLRTLSAQAREVLRCGKTVKGTLNEATYRQRLDENELNGKHDEIVREQYWRRLEYFRMRMLLQHHLIARLQQTFDRVLQLSGDVGQALSRFQEWQRVINVEDYICTLAETVTALEDTSVADLLPKARNFVEEKDETNGEGEKAFEKFWQQIPGWYAQSSLPGLYQPVIGLEQHPLDLKLCQGVHELWNTALTYEQLINRAATVHPYAHRRPHEAAKPTREELRRYPQHYHRLYSIAVVDGDDWTGSILLGSSLTTTVTQLQEPLLAAIPTIVNAPSRWLAMSNYLAAEALTSHLRKLDAGAHNVIYTSAFQDFRRTTVDTFEAATKKASARVLDRVCKCDGKDEA